MSDLLQVLTPDDWTAWRELRLAALIEAPAAFGARLDEWVDASEQRWRNRLSIPNSRNLLAVVDGDAVGMASGLPSEEAGVVQLVSMWVAPTARGRGVADALMTAIETWARSTGSRAVELSVVQGNEVAHALYRRHGYTLTEKSGDLMPDGIHRELVLHKLL